MLECKLDWLSFTWKSGDHFNENEFVLFLSSFPEINNIMVESTIVKDQKGGRGTFYDTVLNFSDHFYLAFCRNRLSGEQSDVNMGVNVSCPAHGLKYLFSLFGYSCSDSLKVISFLHDRGCQFSRIDLAYDDFDKVFVPADFASWFLNIGLHRSSGCGGRMLVTNMRSFDFKGSKQIEGHTFYLGSRDNGKLLRIYDKDYQSGGAIKSIRYEFEFHTKFTPTLVNYILEFGVYPSFQEVMENFIIKVVDVPVGGRKDRSPEFQAWSDFIISSNPPLTRRCTLRATRPDECSNNTLRKFKWYSRNVFKDLSAYAYLFGDESLLDFIHSLDDPGRLESLKRDYRIQQSTIDSALFSKSGLINPSWVDNVKAV